MKRRVLYKFTLSLAAMLIICGTVVKAYGPADYYRCSRDVPVIKALEYLADSSDRDAVGYIVKNDVKIMFRDMRTFGKTYRTNDALSLILDQNDQHMIYINVKHFDAPPQALAALISHEVMHSDRTNSIREEVVAWGQEAKVWQEMCEKHPELKQIGYRKIPLVDRLNAVAVLHHQHKLENEIQTNIVYQGLPERSPGF